MPGLENIVSGIYLQLLCRLDQLLAALHMATGAQEDLSSTDGPGGPMSLAAITPAQPEDSGTEILQDLGTVSPVEHH